MKLVVFAHTPPPLHGQSYMVKLMLDGLQGQAVERSGANSLTVFHVDAKLSETAQAVGKFTWSKVLLLLRYCLTAWWYRFARGADTFYYIPAPGKRAALYRDWIVMAICRPAFKRIIFHWHAVGLGEWLAVEGKPWEKKISHRLLDRPDLAIVLSKFGRADADHFSPRKVEIVPNGIPDPCPDFDQSVLPERKNRLAARSRGENCTFTALFIGACSAAKGLFSTLDALALLNQRAAALKRAKFRLIVAGEFLSVEEEVRFKQRIAQPDLNGPTGSRDGEAENLVRYVGLVEDETKNNLFRQADCLCFPTRYSAEGQPVTIIEALAFGLPVVATCWRGIPELLANSQARLIADQNPSSIADAVEELVAADATEVNRAEFVARYRVRRYVEGLKAAFDSL